jgi:hypothetical protein
MPGLPEAKKDVTSCEKPRKGANNHLMRGCPNGATRYTEGITFRLIGRRTWRTETSKYPEEEKTKVIPVVVASEVGIA